MFQKGRYTLLILNTQYNVLSMILTAFFVTSSSSSAFIKTSATDDRPECSCTDSTVSSAPFASDSLNVAKKGRRDSSPETSSCEKPTRLICLACAFRSAGPACSHSGFIDFAEVSDHVVGIEHVPSAQNSFSTRASPPWHTSLDSAVRQTSTVVSRWFAGMASEEGWRAESGDVETAEKTAAHSKPFRGLNLEYRTNVL